MKASTIWTFIFFTCCIISGCEKTKDIQFVRVAGINMDELGISKSIVSMTLAYYNPNRYSLQLKDASFDLFFNDTQVGHSLQDTLIYIPPRDTFYFPVKLEINMANALKNAWNAFANEEVTIKASGTCKIGKGGIFLPFPIKCETRHAFRFF